MTDTDTYVIGLDGGTEGMRVGLFRPDGTPVLFVREGYPSSHVRPGWAEQNPADWWRAAVNGIRRVLDDSGIAPESIAGLALACTSYTMVFADDSGVPLRPAMMWMDVRSRNEANTIAATGDPALKYTGYTQASAEWMPSKALWIRTHEREVWDRTDWIADYLEWMGFRLTGERAASINSVSIRCYYDRNAGGWPTSLFESAGLGDIMPKLSSRVTDLGEIVGRVSLAAAAETGLPPGIPVAQGGADAFVGMIGLGVVRPGSLALITGSSHLQLLQTEKADYSDGVFGSYTDALIPGQYTIEGGQASTGSVINWFTKLLSGVPGMGELPAGGIDRAVLERLGAGAAGIRPGSDGLLALDYWQGNRTPHIDSEARGMFWGLSLSHGPFHLFRALIESVCFGTENVLATLRSHGHVIDDVVACGGAVNSPTWMQIHAEVSGVPIRTTEVGEAVTLGSGVLAAVGAGLYPDIASAADAMVRTASVIEPDLSKTEEYSFYLAAYLESYEAMKPLMHRMVAHERSLGTEQEARNV
jgi:ribulose kinase